MRGSVINRRQQTIVRFRGVERLAVQSASVVLQEDSIACEVVEQQHALFSHCGISLALIGHSWLSCVVYIFIFCVYCAVSPYMLCKCIRALLFYKAECKTRCPWNQHRRDSLWHTVAVTNPQRQHILSATFCHFWCQSLFETYCFI